MVLQCLKGQPNVPDLGMLRLVLDEPLTSTALVLAFGVPATNEQKRLRQG